MPLLPRVPLLGVSKVGDVDVHVHCGRSFRTAYSLDCPSYECRETSLLSEEMKNVHDYTSLRQVLSQ